MHIKKAGKEWRKRKTIVTLLCERNEERYENKEKVGREKGKIYTG